MTKYVRLFEQEGWSVKTGVATISSDPKKLNIEVLKEGELTWIHIQKPTADEAAFLSQQFPQFHPLNLEDILSRQRPKIDEYSDHLFAVLEFPVYKQDNQVIIPNILCAFIGKDFLVTVDYNGRFGSISRFLKACETSDESRKETFGSGSAYLYYRIIDHLVDRRMAMVSKIGDEIQELEDNIFSTNARDLVRQISSLRRDIISLWQIMWPMRDVVRNLEIKIQRYATIDTRYYFGDLNDHLGNIWNALVEYKEIIEGLHDTYNSLATYRTNDVLRLLTIIMTIGTVLTVVVGFFGMNIPLSPFGSDPGGHPLSWVFLILLSVSVTVLMLLYFKRKDWL